MKRTHVFALAAAALLMTTAAYAARPTDEIQAPRGQEIQAPRGQAIHIPRD
jgi:hypothetical protein